MQVAAIMIPVIFGLMGFAIDLGILYSIKGELKTAANSIALAQAESLIGTDAATTSAQASGQITVSTSDAFGNAYYFHGYPIGGTTGTLTSVISDPSYYGAAADAISSPSPSGLEVSSALAKYVRINLTAQAKLLFWSFLPVAPGDRTVTIAATSIAGISAPLCQACGIEPFAVAAANQGDTTDFGFIPGNIYTLAYLCNAPGAATTLAGTSTLASYVMLNRYDLATTIFPDESSQAYRDGAGGVPASTNSAQACFLINNTEMIWASATPSPCTGGTLNGTTQAAMCGLAARFDPTPPGVCQSIANIDTLDTAYMPDIDPAFYTTYTDYTGNGRRVLTLPIVDTLSATAAMTVLGFRQFLLEPDQGATTMTAGDASGRFGAMYLGTVKPIRQGSFSGCSISSGPGKVVLHL